MGGGGGGGGGSGCDNKNCLNSGAFLIFSELLIETQPAHFQYLFHILIFEFQFQGLIVLLIKVPDTCTAF